MNRLLIVILVGSFMGCERRPGQEDRVPDCSGHVGERRVGEPRDPVISSRDEMFITFDRTIR
jgi:hypothetical protein